MASDEYNTLAGESEGLFKAKGSKFIAYAAPVLSEEDVATFVKTVAAQHFKARHHCYAYRIGLDGDRWRANDDGEPSNSAGMPILGQLDSHGITDAAIVVVRYFGGVKLGVSGLIEAYREAAADAIANGEIVAKVKQRRLRITTDYAHLSDLMNAVKAGGWTVEAQTMELNVELTIGRRADGFEDAYRQLWLTLAKAYPGEERLEESPEGYEVVHM